jgi:hypothetical protein
MNDAWIDGSGLTFQAHATGYDSDEAIIEALKTEPDVMVISAGLAEGAPSGGFGEPVSTMAGTSNEGSFEAPTVTLQTEDDQEHQVRVIGVLNDDFSMLFGAYMGTTTSETLFPANGPNDVSYYIHVAEGANADDVARDIEVKLLPFGAVATDLEQQMKDDQSTQQSFMYVLSRTDRRYRGGGRDRLPGGGRTPPADRHASRTRRAASSGSAGVRAGIDHHRDPRRSGGGGVRVDPRVHADDQRFIHRRSR